MYQANRFSPPPRKNGGFEPPQDFQGGHEHAQPFRQGNQRRVQQTPSNLPHPIQGRGQQAAPPAKQPSHQNARGFHQAPQELRNAPLDRPGWFLQLNTYGKKCAFQVETTKTKGDWFTVTVESAARENPNDPYNKRYLWEQKTVVQMTRDELPIFAAVMLGMLPSARFDNHGDQLKFLEVENQGKNFFIKSGGKGVSLNVAPVPTVEAYHYGTMALTQYCRNFEGLSAEAGLAIIGKLANQLANCGGYKQAQAR